MTFEQPQFDPSQGKPHYRTFHSRAEMYRFMEKIRSSNHFEAGGFTQQVGDKVRLHYQIGNSADSISLPLGIPNSWHSHPNTLPPLSDPSDDPREARLEQEGRELDERANNKISLQDLINIATNKREEDLISLPARQLLVVRYSEAAPTSKVTHFADCIERRRRTTIEEILSSKPYFFLPSPDDRWKVYVEMMDEGISQFRFLLQQAGEQRMTATNYRKILELIGLPHELVSV